MRTAPRLDEFEVEIANLGLGPPNVEEVLQSFLRVTLPSLIPGIVPLSRTEEATVVAEVLWVDHFGNAQLNVGPDEVADMGERVMVRIGDRPPRLAIRVDSFSELKAGQLGLVVDSYGLLAIVLNRRSASEELRLGAGDAAVLEAAVE